MSLDWPKSMVVLMAGVIAGAGISSFVKHQAPPMDSHAGPVRERRPVITERENDSAVAAIEDLERRLFKLRQQQSEMAERLDARTPFGTTSVTAEPATSQVDADDFYAQARESAISSVMDREVSDSSASARVANQLIATFAEANLAGHLVSAVDCRARVCKVDVQHEYGFDAGEALTAIQQALITGSEETIEGFYRTVDHPDGSSTTRLYVTNGAESLPDGAQ